MNKELENVQMTS